MKKIANPFRTLGREAPSDAPLSPLDAGEKPVALSQILGDGWQKVASVWESCRAVQLRALQWVQRCGPKALYSTISLRLLYYGCKVDEKNARLLRWDAPWVKRHLAALELQLAAKSHPGPAGTKSAEPTPPWQVYPHPAAEALMTATPSLAGHPGQLTARQVAQRPLPLYESAFHPALDQAPPPVVTTFAELQHLLTAPDSPLRAPTEALRRRAAARSVEGMEAYLLAAPQAVAFGSAPVTGEGGEPATSGLGVIHFTVDPRLFTAQVRRAFLKNPPHGTPRPLVLNPWPSGRGLTAVVILPAGPESYAQKIADLVACYELYCAYAGLACQLWQSEDPHRPCAVYWDPQTDFCPDLLA